MAWHITPVENVPSIIRDGLIPRIGPRSAAVQEEAPRVHLFSSLGDLESAEWALDEFEDERLALLHVVIPGHVGHAADHAWIEHEDVIPSDQITVVSFDLDSFVPSIAHRVLDQVEDPLGSIEAFRMTRAKISKDVAASIIDVPEEDLTDNVLVYAARGHILEQDGTYTLTIENASYASGDTSLAQMEDHLFAYFARETPVAALKEEGPAL